MGCNTTGLRAVLTCSSTLHGNARRDTPDQRRSRDPFDYTKNPFWNQAKSVLTEPHGTASTCGFRITHQPHGGGVGALRGA